MPWPSPKVSGGAWSWCVASPPVAGLGRAAGGPGGARAGLGPNPRPWVALPAASGLGVGAAHRGSWKRRLGEAVPNMSPWCGGRGGVGVPVGIPGDLPPRPLDPVAAERCCSLGQLPGLGNAPVLSVWYALPVRGAYGEPGDLWHENMWPGNQEGVQGRNLRVIPRQPTLDPKKHPW